MLLFYFGAGAKPGFGGTGYSSGYNAAIQNGVCIDCNGPDFRPLTDGKINFCSFDAVGRKMVAASGGGVYSPKPAINAINEWTYAVRPFRV